MDFLKVKFDDKGLIPAIAQDIDTKEVLMMAWMNKEALEKTIETNDVYYFSRSRNKLWRKGETSGQTQKLKKLIFDCDMDTILLIIEQKGVACHTGRKTCFYQELEGNELVENCKIEIDSETLYNN